MLRANFSLREGERALKESACVHLLRPDSSLKARLCHLVLTDRRLVACDAVCDITGLAEKSVGDPAWEVSLGALQLVGPGPDVAEPSLDVQVQRPEGRPERVFVYFRDPGWHSGAPEREQERTEWIKAIGQGRAGLGLPPAVVLPKLQTAPPPAPPRPEAAAEPVGPPAAAAPESKRDQRGKLRAGAVLGGKYRVLRHIGSGGMGLVYEGRDLSLDRPVAIKQMREDVCSSAGDKARFLQEAHFAATLHHPFIVDVYAIIEDAEGVFLVFEFVDGETVQETIDRQGRMPVAEALKALRYVCDALAFAHSQRIIHRDLKTSNIMLTRQGYAKVMDFGIARQAKDTAARLSSLDTSGTFPYMAPEQELGACDARSDIFALGATLYEMLSGQLPFPGPNFYLQKEKHAYAPLPELVPGLPLRVTAAVDRCLRFDAAQRFQRVEELAQAVCS